MSELIEQVKSKANSWLSSQVIDTETKDLVKSLLDQKDSKELIDNFYKDLEFGTGGLRGVMGADAFESIATMTQQNLERWRSMQEDIFRAMSSHSSTGPSVSRVKDRDDDGGADEMHTGR